MGASSTFLGSWVCRRHGLVGEPQDAGGDEDEQFLAGLAGVGVFEEEAQEGNAPEERDAVLLVGGGPHVDAADDGGVAVLHQYLGGGFLLGDGGLAVGASQSRVGLVVGGVHEHQNAPIRRDVGRD